MTAEAGTLGPGEEKEDEPVANGGTGIRLKGIMAFALVVTAYAAAREGFFGNCPVCGGAGFVFGDQELLGVKFSINGDECPLLAIFPHNGEGFAN